MHQRRSVEPTMAVDLLMSACRRYEVKPDEGGKILRPTNVAPPHRQAQQQLAVAACACACV